MPPLADISWTSANIGTCSSGHPLSELHVKGSLVGRRTKKQCIGCGQLIKSVVSADNQHIRYSCKACQYHLCEICYDAGVHRVERNDAVAEQKAQCHELRERLQEAMEEQEQVTLDYGTVEERLLDLEAAVPEVEEELEALRQQTSENEEARLAGQTADEVVRLEGELELLAEEARRHRENEEAGIADEGDDVADTHRLQHQCQPLLLEQQRLQQELKQHLKSAAALDAERPTLEAEAAESRRLRGQQDADLARLKAELDRLVDTDDIAAQSPGGHTSPTRRVLSTANAHEVWNLEAEAQASTLRVSELEQALEQSCKRRRQDIVEAEARTRRLANMGASMNNDGSAKPSEHVRQLASGMKTEQARFTLGNRLSPSDHDDTGSSLRKRVERSQRSSPTLQDRIHTSPRPRPQTETLSTALWGTPVSSPGSRLVSPRERAAAEALHSPRENEPAFTASHLVAENSQLRGEVEALHAALLQAGSAHAAGLLEAHCSPLDAEPQLEAALTHSRTRLRTMLRQQLEDSRKLMGTLHQDIVEAEQGLLQERRAREKCAQRLQLAEHAAARGQTATLNATPTKFRAAGAASSPMPQPPQARTPSGLDMSGVSEGRGLVMLGSPKRSLERLSLLGLSDADDSSPGSASASPLSYGGGAWLL